MITRRKFIQSNMLGFALPLAGVKTRAAVPTGNEQADQASSAEGEGTVSQAQPFGHEKLALRFVRYSTEVSPKSEFSRKSSQLEVSGVLCTSATSAGGFLLSIN